MTSLATREREALCDLALSLGADAPTLCSGWSVRHLVAHLLVREREPWRAAGIVLPQRASGTEERIAALAQEPLGDLVARLRSVPLPLRLVDPLLSSLEFFVHHEDLRRAQPEWDVRALSAADEALVWRMTSLAGRALVRRAGVPVVISSGARTAVLRRGEAPVRVVGPVSELALFLFGRSQVVGLAFDGPAASVDRLQRANLGV